MEQFAYMILWYIIMHGHRTYQLMVVREEHQQLFAVIDIVGGGVPLSRSILGSIDFFGSCRRILQL